MNYWLKDAIDQWEREVENEATRLIEEGTPRYDAIVEAQGIVRARRQAEANRKKREPQP